MKKLICVLVAVFAMSVTSSALEAVDNDYVNIKNAVLTYVASGEYQKAVECIDLYGYTVQENEGYYNDLQNDRVAISEVMYSSDFIETVSMLQTLSQLKRYELAMVYIGEQQQLFEGCPNFLKQLSEWATYFNEQIQTYKFAGTYAGDGITLVTSVDEDGTVVELLTLKKGEIGFVLADAESRGFIYTERNDEMRAEGAYFDNFQNSGMIYATHEKDGTVTLEITSDAYNANNAAGTYKLIKQ